MQNLKPEATDSPNTWRIEPSGAMRVPVVVYASDALVRDLDDKVLEQAARESPYANKPTAPDLVALQEALDGAKEKLMEKGFSPENVEVKLLTKKEGIARDIVNEALLGYDLIIMGRRGVSAVKEFFLGSISQKVINMAKDISVLIVN